MFHCAQEISIVYSMASNEQAVLRWKKLEVPTLIRGVNREIGFQTVTAVGHYLFVHGSFRLDYEKLSTYVFNLQLTKWTELTYKNAPSQRFGHVAALVDDKLLIFGGYRVDGSYGNDLYENDLSLRTWSKLNPTSPPPRLFTSSAHYHEQWRKLFVVCGKTQANNLSDKVYALDPYGLGWTACIAKGQAPQCGFHGSCMSTDKIFIIGGVSRTSELSGNEVHVFDFSRGLQQCVWSRVEVEGETARNNIGCSLLYFHPGRILHFGGKQFNTGPTGDREFLHWYDLEKGTVDLVPYFRQASVSCTGPGPTERRNFGFVRLFDKVIVFGGYQERADPLYILNISALC